MRTTLDDHPYTGSSPPEVTAMPSVQEPPGGSNSALLCSCAQDRASAPFAWIDPRSTTGTPCFGTTGNVTRCQRHSAQKDAAHPSHGIRQNDLASRLPGRCRWHSTVDGGEVEPGADNALPLMIGAVPSMMVTNVRGRRSRRHYARRTVRVSSPGLPSCGRGWSPCPRSVPVGERRRGSRHSGGRCRPGAAGRSDRQAGVGT